MVKILASQGWSKNEIVYEMQRVFGNDVLITPSKLDEERTLATRLAPWMMFGMLVASVAIKRKAGAPPSSLMKKNAPLTGKERDILKSKLRNR